MPRFFVEPVCGSRADIAGEDARHIARSLRMRPGEIVILCDGAFDYRCRLEAVEPDLVTAEVLEKRPNESEPAVRIRLYQALPKGEKLDWIVQKAVELGVAEIVPVLTDRCISRPDAKSMEKKRARLQRVALEAAKQSGRGAVPPVLPLLPFSKAVEAMTEADCAVLFYEKARSPLSTVLNGSFKSIAVMVGSEGGFSPEEAAFAASKGVAAASLGKRILRCETAPLCALSAILYAYGEF